MNRKGQSAAEFMLIFVFIMGAISFFMVIVGIYTQDLTVSENDKQIDSFANSIISEFDLLQEVNSGYQREVVIPSYLLERYNVTITDNYLIIENLEVPPGESNVRYYEISGNYQLSTHNDTSGNMYLVLSSSTGSVDLTNRISLDTPTSPVPSVSAFFGIDTIISKTTLGNTTTSLTSGGNSITSTIIDANTTIFVSNTNDTITQKLINNSYVFFNGSGSIIFTIPITDTFTITTDSSGDLVIQNESSNGVVQIIDNNGNIITQQITGNNVIINKTIEYNSNVLLSWNGVNVVSECTASGDWAGLKPSSGNETRTNLRSDKVYVLDCPGVSENTIIIFNIFVKAPLIPTLTFSASPQVIAYNTQTNLSWQAQNMYDITSCTSSWNGSKGISGSELTPNLTTNTTYSLTCTNPSGSINENVTVEVLPLPEINFTNVPSIVVLGTSANLSWDVKYANSCNASNSWIGDKGINGTEVTPVFNSQGVYTYTLTCSGPGGINSKNLDINVINNGILTITSNVFNYNIANVLGNPTNPLDVELTINSGVIVGSTSTSIAALSTGNLPAGSTVTIINNGRIQGKGGDGGRTADHNAAASGSTDGGIGGNALDLTLPITINNANGEIWSGGGGGGGAGVCHSHYHACWWAAGGGSGGGAGSNPGSAYGPGSAGTLISGGSGAPNPQNLYQCWGGSGGNPGISGTNAYTTTGPTCVGQKNGGLAGYAINDWSKVTFIGNKGDIRGQEYGKITATGGVITSNTTHMIHTFTSSGTFSLTQGGGDVNILVVGGGGGGAGATTCNAVASGGGGGGGGASIDTFLLNKGQSFTVTVGTGGANGVNYANGGNGGSSSFGNLISVTGGGGGIGASTTGGWCGSSNIGGSGGSGGFPGGGSGNGGIGSTGGGGGGKYGVNPGNGGIYGGRGGTGGQVSYGTGANGASGLIPGGGGGGGSIWTPGTASSSGGAGARGEVRVSYLK